MPRPFEFTGLLYTPPSVVRMNPVTFEAQRPVMLHEFLHAYHGKLMPQGFQNRDVLLYYDRARTAQLYPANEYLLSNHREFFAMTASVFLYGRAAREPFTRSNLKQKQPIYYEYLVRLFGFILRMRQPEDKTQRIFAMISAMHGRIADGIRQSRNLSFAMEARGR